MKNLRAVFAAVLISVFGQSCNLTNSGYEADGYPTTIKPLKASELEALSERFSEKNGAHICFEMDKYGFLKFAFCPARPILRVIVTQQQDSLVRRAKLTLLENREFTGVADTSALVVLRMNEMPGCIKCDGSPGDIGTIRVGIDFGNQIYHSLEILNSEYAVALDSAGVIEIVGHWFENVVVPTTDAWSEEKSKQSLVGRSITWYGFGGEPHTFVVSREDMPKPARKVIVQHEAGENIELRVAWEIPVGKDFTMWNIYIDTTTGEDLLTSQLFMT